MSAQALATWLMIFMRGTGVAVLLPQMAGKTAPIFVRLAFTAAVATLLFGVVPQARVPETLSEMVIALAGEVLLGLAIGFVMSMPFMAVDYAGRIISSEIGLSASPGFMGPSGATDSTTEFLGNFAVVIFFMSGGHLMAIGAFAKSFSLTHAGSPLFNPAGSEALTLASAHLIETGLRIAAPFLALNFLVSLAFSVLGRIVPRMNVFIMSASVRGLAGLALLSSVGALLARYLYAEFAALPAQMMQVLPPRH